MERLLRCPACIPLLSSRPIVLALMTALTLVTSCAGPSTPSTGPDTGTGSSPQGLRAVAEPDDDRRSPEVRELVEKIEASGKKDQAPDPAAVELLARRLFEAFAEGELEEATDLVLSEEEARHFLLPAFAEIMSAGLAKNIEQRRDSFRGIIYHQPYEITSIEVDPMEHRQPRAGSSIFQVPVWLVPSATIHYQVAGREQRRLRIESIIHTDRGWRFLQVQLLQAEDQ